MNPPFIYEAELAGAGKTVCLLGPLQEEALGPCRDELVQTDALALAVEAHLVHAAVLRHAVVCGVRAAYVFGVQVQHCDRQLYRAVVTANFFMIRTH